MSHRLLTLFAGGLVRLLKAASFVTGSSQYFSLADRAATSFGDEDFGGGIWVNLASKANAVWIIAKGNVGSLAYEYALWYDVVSDRFKFAVSSGAAQGAVSATTLGSPALNTWYFVQFKHDSNNNVVAIRVNNGTLDTTSYSGGCHDGTGTLQIGNALGTTDYGTWRCDSGYLAGNAAQTDDASFYNSGSGKAYFELTAAEQARVRLWWDFSGSPWTDATGGGADLTSNNSVGTGVGVA